MKGTMKPTAIPAGITWASDKEEQYGKKVYGRRTGSTPPWSRGL